MCRQKGPFPERAMVHNEKDLKSKGNALGPSSLPMWMSVPWEHASLFMLEPHSCVRPAASRQFYMTSSQVPATKPNSSTHRSCRPQGKMVHLLRQGTHDVGWLHWHGVVHGGCDHSTLKAHTMSIWKHVPWGRDTFFLRSKYSFWWVCFSWETVNKFRLGWSDALLSLSVHPWVCGTSKPLRCDTVGVHCV